MRKGLGIVAVASLAVAAGSSGRAAAQAQRLPWSPQATAQRRALPWPVPRPAAYPGPFRVIRAQAQGPVPRPAPAGSQPPRLAERTELRTATVARPQLGERRPGEHPILPAVRWARQGVQYIASIQDYACTFVKRERVNGTLGEYQYMQMKVRHRPFSVYLKFLGPESMKGQEVIYVEGRNDGNLLAHGTGLKALAGTLSLPPDGFLAMQGNRYAITNIGLLNLAKELLAVGQSDARFGECEVHRQAAKVNGRQCTCMQFKHPVPRREFRYHVARIFVDDQLNLPIRYESYDWPQQKGGKPRLTEEYTYLNLKLNNGFSDADFDPRNPGYDFP